MMIGTTCQCTQCYCDSDRVICCEHTLTNVQLFNILIILVVGQTLQDFLFLSPYCRPLGSPHNLLALHQPGTESMELHVIYEPGLSLTLDKTPSLPTCQQCATINIASVTSGHRQPLQRRCVTETSHPPL